VDSIQALEDILILQFLCMTDTHALTCDDDFEGYPLTRIIMAAQ